MQDDGLPPLLEQFHSLRINEPHPSFRRSTALQVSASPVLLTVSPAKFVPAAALRTTVCSRTPFSPLWWVFVTTPGEKGDIRKSGWTHWEPCDRIQFLQEFNVYAL